MPSKCKHPECKKDASYNYPDKIGRIYCKTHAEEGMVSSRSDKRVCIHPDHDNNKPRASFNFPNEKKPVYCKQHAEKGMINLNNKNNKCQGCQTKQPSYGFLGEKAVRCSKCALEGMVDLVSNLCTFEECRKNANYGFFGQKATRCKSHAEQNMVDVKNNKCKLCSKQATFGIDKPTHCKEHKTEGMEDKRHTTEICQQCELRATYGTGKRPTHCKNHKTDEMKDVVSKMCVKCGEIQPIFGYTKDNLFCGSCKEKDMKDIVNKMCIKCNEHQPTYNYKGVKPPLYCSGCALDGMVDIINTMCKSCGLFCVSKKPHLCVYCKPKSTMREKTKEMIVVNYFNEQGYEFIHNKSVGYVCGNYRPDIRIDAQTHIVIVEIDENQHKQYDMRCEIARMFNIFQAEGLQCVFIRYNPDVFKVKGIAKKIQTDKRLKELNNITKYYIENIPEEPLSVYRLFYDNDDGEYCKKYEVEKQYNQVISNMTVLSL